MRPQLRKWISLTIAIMLWLTLCALSIYDQAILGQVFAGMEETFAQKLRYSATLTAFFLANTYFFFQVFGRIEKLDVLTLLWRLFIIGMIGITVILILIVTNRMIADMNMIIYLRPIFFNLNVYILVIFFLSATFIFRRFILYQKTRFKVIGLNIFWVFLLLSFFMTLETKVFTPGSALNFFLFLLFGLLCLFLSANVSWTAYLNFSQKLKALGLFSLIVVVIITYGITLLRIPDEFNLLSEQVPAMARMTENLQRYAFLNFLIIFTVIYCGISILVLFFNLPASSVFEARSSEIASFNKINQAIQANLDFTDILETLLDASMLIANAKTGWIEVLAEGDSQKSLFKSGKGIEEAEATRLKQGFDLTEKVARE